MSVPTMCEQERSHDDPIGHSLDRFFGTWTENEARELLESVEFCEQVDDDGLTWVRPDGP